MHGVVPTGACQVSGLPGELRPWLRRDAVRSVDTLWSVIGRLVDLITPLQSVRICSPPLAAIQKDGILCYLKMRCRRLPVRKTA